MLLAQGFKNLDTLDLKRIQLRAKMRELSQNAPVGQTNIINKATGKTSTGVGYTINK